jgi:adhesin transport system membrane fusion protein
MISQVDIVTGRKTILQYLLKPIFKARDESLTER